MEYREITKLNQSLLKKILISPKEFLIAQARYEQTDSEEDYFVFGSVLDIMLTGVKADFDAKYVVVPNSLKCSDTVKTIVQGIFEEVGSNKLPVNHTGLKDVILKHCKYQNYQPNWKDDTKVEKIIKEGGEYYDFLQKGSGKTIISESDYVAATQCMMMLKQDPYTKGYCNRKVDPKNVEFLDKVIVEFEFHGLEIKGELDRVVINHATQRITPLDFKSTGKSINGFKFDFWQYRYDLQAATYTVGISQHPEIIKLIDLGYILEDFLYIVVEKDLKNAPRVFKVPKDVLQIGLVGGERSNGHLYEGLAQAIQRYEFAARNNAWEYPMEYYQNNGFILLEP
jgi:hypothetical protein